ncbi:MAG: phospho-N-acetylmuramoyl-pentapeptide-transferase [Chlamydiota bacterium]
MLLWLVGYLQNIFEYKIPTVFSYSSTRMLLAALTSLLFTIFLGPWFIRKLYQLKIGQCIRSAEECPVLAQLHEKKKDTPTMGGILILLAMLLSLFLWMDWAHIFTWILCVTTIALGTIGAIDDYLKLKYKNSKGLKSRKKFLLQLLFASLFATYLLVPAVSSFVGKKIPPPTAKEQIVKQLPKAKKTTIEVKTLTTKEYISRIYVPFVKGPLFLWKGWLVILAFIWILFVVIGSSNAVNLTDGLDGLAAGSLMMASLALAFFAFVSNHIDLARYLNILYIEGSGEVGVYLCALAGASLGFLWYNGYPAQVFMGDTGSLALGGILGVSAVLLKREVFLALVGGVFVAEALSVILQVVSYRFRNKKRIFLCAPLHHHFEYKGWAETKIVVRFWIISLLLALIGIASLKFQ